MEAVLSPGLLVAGRYRIESFIGVSELGEVYATLDLQVGRECAIKLLPQALRHAPAAWNAFQEQARNVAALSGDAIARAVDFGSDPALGRPFVVSEKIGFPSVAALVSAEGRIEKGLWSQALSTFARSLDAASAASLAHGNIKPNNLFFSPEHAGWARISDFGMVLLRAACPPNSGVAPLGWAALEQTRGEPPSAAGDIFSLGLVTFYALTGRHYLSTMWQAAPDPGSVLAELQATPPPAHSHARAQGSDLPEVLNPWFARALNPVPSERFTSAEEAAQVFAELLASEPRRVPGAALHQGSGVAAAVAAPLLFQDLPRPSAPTPPVEAPRSSRPPGFAAPRAAITEHVAGLPPQPPIALLAAVGVGLIVVLAGAGYGVVRLLSRGEPAPALSAAEVASALPSASAVTVEKPPAAPAVTSSADSRPKTRAHFVCAPVACEWIVCDGENVKKGQLDLELAPGKHSCSASRYGYRTAVTEFTLEADKTTKVLFELLATRAASAASPPKVARPKKAAATSTASKTGTGKTTKTATSTAKPAASSKPSAKAR